MILTYHFLVIFLTFFLSIYPVLSLPENIHPVCVIGAGPTGLTIAHELEAKHISTVLFEKQPEVGGKCQSFYGTPNTDIFHPLGAILFTNKTYINTLPLIEAAHVPHFSGMSPLNGWKTFTFSPLTLPLQYNATINVTSSLSLSETQLALLNSEVTKYLTFWMNQFAPNYTALRYTNGIPSELTVPIGEWLTKNGYQILPVIMSSGMYPFGYGDLTHTPAIYMLQYFTPDILGYFADSSEGYVVDFHKVMVHYAKSIKGCINTNSRVTKIDRSHKYPVLTVQSLKGEQKMTCSKVILAFPPVIEALKSNTDGVGITLSSAETAVFSKVGLTAYWSGAVTIPQVPSQSIFIQSPPTPVGEPVAVLRLFNKSEIATTYSWGPFQPSGRSNMSVSQIQDLLIRSVSATDFGEAIIDTTHAVIDYSTPNVKQLRAWDYFPHFQSEDLANGIYDRYNALQGQSNTFYASGLNGFETVEFSIRAGKELVDIFF